MDLKSNEPFWLIKNGLINSFPSLRTDIECDVLIVGGGITGSLIAHQCIEDKYKTILIDKREIGNGSSSATTSMLQYEIDTPLHQLIELIGETGALASYWACYEAIDTLGELCKNIGSKAGFKKKDSLYFAAQQKDVEMLYNEFKARKKADFPVSWLEAASIYNQYGLTDTHGGIVSKQGASVDAFTLIHEILEHNISKGLQVYDKTELVEVKYGINSNKITLNTGAQINAKKIIYCVGYESSTMIKEKFVDLLSTYATVSEVTSHINKAHQNLLIWNTAQPYHYIRTTDDGRWLIGGEDETFNNPQKRDALIAKKETKLVQTFNKHLPETPFQADFAWAGTFGETKDGLPYIGIHKDFPNSYFVLGFGGNGITFSVTGMEMTSQWLKGIKHPLSRWFEFDR